MDTTKYDGIDHVSLFIYDELQVDAPFNSCILCELRVPDSLLEPLQASDQLRHFLYEHKNFRL